MQVMITHTHEYTHRKLQFLQQKWIDLKWKSDQSTTTDSGKEALWRYSPALGHKSFPGWEYKYTSDTDYIN